MKRADYLCFCRLIGRIVRYLFHQTINTSAPGYCVFRGLYSFTLLFLVLWSRQRGCPRKRQRRRGVKSLPSNRRVGNAVGVSIDVVRPYACVTFWTCYVKILSCVFFTCFII